VLYIAQNETDERPVRTDDVAAALGVPRNYLSKILHTLVRHRLLMSTRGPLGGFHLAVDPDKVTLERIVGPFDDIEPGRTCILGRPQCSDRNPCPAHTRWKSISQQVSDFFRRTTLGELVREPGTLTGGTRRRPTR
jgi:Rrf2 family protein